MLIIARIVLMIGVSLAGPAMAEVDVFMRAAGFALTGSDDAEPKAVDRANCIFQIGKTTFHLNNVHVDRLLFRPWKAAVGEERWVTVDLHGDATVYEETTEPLKDDGSSALDYLREHDPEAFKPHHRVHKEHQLRLDTADIDRVKRAWVYLYGHGCNGKKSAF
jgi:hypothetical protein